VENPLNCPICDTRSHSWEKQETGSKRMTIINIKSRIRGNKKTGVAKKIGFFKKKKS
jgi:hypothetical protein